MTTKWYCTSMLPRHVRDRMARVLQIDPGVPPGESPRRARELAETLFAARMRYPQLFKHSKEM